MKFFSTALLLFLFVFAAQAQIKLPPKESNTPAKQTPLKTVETKPTYSEPTLTLKVISDMDCKFYLDGELKATLAKDEIEKLQLKAGDYQFKAVSIANSQDVFKEIHTVKKEEIGTEKFYEISLQSVINLRLAEVRLAAQKETERQANERALKEKAEAQRLATERKEEERIKKENELAEKEAKRKEIEKSYFRNIDNQKPFEGKIVFQYSWENLPSETAQFYKNGTYVCYYKNNKYRIEMNILGKTDYIYDYGKGDILILSQYLLSRTATLMKTNSDKDKISSIEYFDEFKTIAGYNCQKALYKTTFKNDSISKTPCYVNRDFTTPGETILERNIDPFLMLDSRSPINIGGNIAFYISNAINISEEPVDDNLFSLIPPKGYKLTDNR